MFGAEMIEMSLGASQLRARQWNEDGRRPAHPVAE
jgi:hypothetical protein